MGSLGTLSSQVLRSILVLVLVRSEVPILRRDPKFAAVQRCNWSLKRTSRLGGFTAVLSRGQKPKVHSQSPGSL